MSAPDAKRYKVELLIDVLPEYVGISCAICKKVMVGMDTRAMRAMSVDFARLVEAAVAAHCSTHEG